MHSYGFASIMILILSASRFKYFFSAVNRVCAVYIIF